MEIKGDYRSTVEDLAATIGILVDNTADVFGIQTVLSEIMPGDIWARLRPTEQECCDAIKKGAVAVLCRDKPRHTDMTVLQTDAFERDLGVLLNALYQEPSSHMKVMAVTGTNGKTTVSYLCAAAMQYLQHPATLIGSLGYGRVGQIRSQQHTTPPAGELQQKLAAARDRGDVFVAMEASSHGLDQGRLTGVMIDVAVFTNLTHEHLDYHKTINDYLAAKQKLVMMNSVGVAVMNYDDPSGQLMIERTNKTLWPCSMESVPRGFKRWSYGSVRESTIKGFCLKITTHDASVLIESPLIGKFNAENLMYAHAVLCLLGIDANEAAHALGSIDTIPGRMQRMRFNELLCEVIVDYSHTPNALERVLTELDNIKSGRLWLVFGCGGDRDKKKRSIMGAIAERLADEVIITEDNSRSESFQAISQDILSGMKCPGYAHVIEGRYQAIKYALREAAESDIVLIAGKGHETTLENQSGVKAFSDEAAVEAILVE